MESGTLIKSIGLKHYVPRIIEYPKTNWTIEMSRSLGLSKQFTTALDMGPKHMAVFLRSEAHSIAVFQPIFNKLVEYSEELRLLQRRMDRQRRASNPDNYATDGMIKKKKRFKWKRSKAYSETQASGFALCLDKRRQSHSCPNRKQQSSENREEPMIVCADSLKLLLGEPGRVR